MKAMRKLKAGPDDAGRRLDRVLRRILANLPLAAIYGGLRRGRILLNGRRARPEDRLSEGDEIAIDAELEAAGYAEKAPLKTVKNALENGRAEKEAVIRPLVIFKNRDFLFLNKPAGIPSQGYGGLDRLVQDAFEAEGGPSLAFRPGPLHRLDRNTSGIICFSQSIDGARNFTGALRAGGMRKFYLALVEGRLDGAADWEDWLVRDEDRRTSAVASGPEDGQAARAEASAFPLIAEDGGSLVLVELKTGLTHQIRVQAASRGHPLEGDAKYGGGRGAAGYLLHAWNLVFREGVLAELPRRLEAPLPAEARARLAARFGEKMLNNALKAGMDIMDAN